MDSNFLKFIATPDLRAMALRDVRIAENELFSVHPNPVAFEEKLSYTLGKQLLSNLAGVSDKHKALLELKSAIETMEVVDLVLGFQPSNMQIEVLGKLVKRLWGDNCLINPVIDTSIQGGARVSHAGKYVDLSVVKLIDNYWAVHRDYWVARFGIN